MTILTVGIIAGCAANPSGLISPQPAGPTIVVVETRVVTVASGYPTVAVHLRATPLIGDQGLATSAHANWSALPGSIAACDLAAPQPQRLGPEDPGTVFPLLAPDREPIAAAAAVHDGWLTYQMERRPRCVATVAFEAGYLPVEGLSSISPGVPAGPARSTVATIQVRGDGTALEVSPRPVLTSPPTPPAWAANDREVISGLNDLIEEWNVASTPVVAGLIGTNVNIAEWAVWTESNRQDLGNIVERMGRLIGSVRNPAGIDAIGDIVVNYADKIDAYNALAAAGLKGNEYEIREATGQMRIAVARVPTLIRRFLSAYAQILTPDDRMFFEGLE